MRLQLSTYLQNTVFVGAHTRNLFRYSCITTVGRDVAIRPLKQTLRLLLILLLASARKRRADDSYYARRMNNLLISLFREVTETCSYSTT